MDRILSLYDDLDTKQKSDQVAGWSSGIKLLQSQMQLKKASLTQVKRDAARKSTPMPLLEPDKKDDEEQEASVLPIFPNLTVPSKPIINASKEVRSANNMGDPQMWDIEWVFEDEYSPFRPNDYDKAVRDLRDRRDKEKEKEDEDRRKRREERTRNRDRDEDRGKTSKKDDSDEEEFEERPSRVGVAIAPPPVLQDASTIDVTPKTSSGPNHGASVAAKIMAKYGFKEGQGLGKKEQGMAVALQVEKTSKRGGRIIHEKEMMPPPLQPLVNLPSPPYYDSATQKTELSNTSIVKEPSKVVLLRNMVGPGEVDQDLEPEVKDECNTKYGEVIKVLIHELPNGPQDEAVRIFVEFKRLESATKAVIDLNGRFFGGRQVKAGFYNYDRFSAFQLLD